MNLTTTQQNEFSSDGEDDLEIILQDDSCNNNSAASNAVQMPLGVQRSLSPLHVTDDPHSSMQTQDQQLNECMELLQEFMAGKGLIDPSLNNEDLRKSLDQLDNFNQQNKGRGKVSKQQESATCTGNRVNNKGVSASKPCASEVTIYKRAVPQVLPQQIPQINAQVDSYLNQARCELEIQGVNNLDNTRNVSGSSKEMDISDETMEIQLCHLNNVIPLIAEPTNPAILVTPGTSGRNTMAMGVVEQQEPSPEACADQLVKDAESARAQVHGVKGESQLNVTLIDQDYQMIDSHLDDNIRKKILNLEYIDFSKLIANHRTFKDEEEGQRLEIVNKNGMSYLSPIQIGPP